MLGGLIYCAVFFGIPVIMSAVFGITLYRYISAVKKNKAVPGSFSDNEIKKRRIIMIIMSVIFGILTVMVICLCALLYMAVAYM